MVLTVQIFGGNKIMCHKNLSTIFSFKITIGLCYTGHLLTCPGSLIRGFRVHLWGVHFARTFRRL